MTEKGENCNLEQGDREGTSREQRISVRRKVRDKVLQWSSRGTKRNISGLRTEKELLE